MIDIPLNLILFSLPALIYLIVLNRQGQSWREAFHKLGLRASPPVYYLWGLGIFAVLGVLGLLATRSLSVEVLQNPNVTLSQYEGVTLSVSTVLWVLLREAFYTALGEEIFFRGFLGGWLFRKFGFALGNIVQAVIFLLPHLLLLAVSLSLWPLLLVQLFAGWLLGWLRYRSDSIFPGWLIHSFTNTVSALVFAVR